MVVEKSVGRTEKRSREKPASGRWSYLGGQGHTHHTRQTSQARRGMAWHGGPATPSPFPPSSQSQSRGVQVPSPRPAAAPLSPSRAPVHVHYGGGVPVPRPIQQFPVLDQVAVHAEVRPRAGYHAPKCALTEVPRCSRRRTHYNCPWSTGRAPLGRVSLSKTGT